ncbi:hypothetical protein FOXYSP1_13322 [Fusarium oxysporum f. sp. phaseoli]
MSLQGTISSVLPKIASFSSKYTIRISIPATEKSVFSRSYPNRDQASSNANYYPASNWLTYISNILHCRTAQAMHATRNQLSSMGQDATFLPTYTTP